MGADFDYDGRKIPDSAMDVIRKIAVRAVVENKFSPEIVISILGFSRSDIYDWLNIFKKNGYKGLEHHSAPGAPKKLTIEMQKWLKKTVLETNPEFHGYDTVLWTRDIMSSLLKDKYGLDISVQSISNYLQILGLTLQKPRYCPREQDSKEVEYFVKVKFPRIRRLAHKINAEIAFCDEAGIGLDTHSGRTWGLKGQTPEVKVTGKRGGFNILSSINAEGNMKYTIVDGKINSETFIDFTKQLLKGRDRPLVLIVDRASFHTSAAVREHLCQHRKDLRIFYLPSYSPELNPDEHVWEDLKDKKIGRQPVKDKKDLLVRVRSTLKSIQRNCDRIKSFFENKETLYASIA